MSGNKTKPMVCVRCGMRIVATIQQAKRHGWEVWVGGARCKACGELHATEERRAARLRSLEPAED